METYEIDKVVGCDVDRAKAIINAHVGMNLNFEVRDLPNAKVRPHVSVPPGTVILWLWKGVVHKSAKFSLSYDDEDWIE
jgi:hypothetical protein